MPGPINIGLRNQVVAYSNTGMKQGEIAQIIGVSRATVNRVLRRRVETGSVDPGKSTGRPRITTAREDRRLFNIARRNRTKSSTSISAELRAQHLIRISRSTVNRRLVQRGYRARRMVKKPLLTARHRHNRLQWAQTHRHVTVAHWNHVVFADESRFLLHPTDGRIRVRRLPGEQLLDECVQAKVAFGGGSVHVWGAFCTRGVSQLVVLDQNVTGMVYQGILEQHLLPFTQRLFQNNFRFQHDNAPAHTSRVVRDFLQQHDVGTLPQPSVSPDTNPIEHLWDELGRAVRNRHIQPTNLGQLGLALVEEWNRIPLNRLVTLVESMPRRLADIIVARGGHTRY